MQNPRLVGQGPAIFGRDFASPLDSAAPPRAPTHRAAKPVYQLTIQAPSDADAIRVLRALLKLMWRRHGLRCLRIEQVQP